VVEAARLANADEFIQSLPEGYATRIGERGVRLSGGQRQRLAIARAILARPEVLIFDEATSHLDTLTERVLWERLPFAGKTVVLVAHRLSTIRRADYVYVLRDGQVAQHGTHEELIASDGPYSDLWTAQTDFVERFEEALDYDEPYLLLDEAQSARFWESAA
jgi:ABC-type multidrug transport system fused ATPase/permease subunit